MTGVAGDDMAAPAARRTVLRWSVLVAVIIMQTNLVSMLARPVIEWMLSWAG